MKFHCQGCGQKVSATDDMIGQVCPCPNCSEMIAVPGIQIPVLETELVDESDFSEKPNNSRRLVLLRVLRWVGVVPAAIIGQAIITAVISFLMSIDRDGSLFDSDTSHAITHSYVSAASFTFIGAWIAPSRQVIVAIVLSVLAFLSVVAVSIVAFREIGHASFRYFFVAGVLCANIFGGISGCFAMRERNN